MLALPRVYPQARLLTELYAMNFNETVFLLGVPRAIAADTRVHRILDVTVCGDLHKNSFASVSPLASRVL